MCFRVWVRGSGFRVRGDLFTLVLGRNNGIEVFGTRILAIIGAAAVHFEMTI